MYIVDIEVHVFFLIKAFSRNIELSVMHFGFKFDLSLPSDSISKVMVVSS